MVFLAQFGELILVSFLRSYLIMKIPSCGYGNGAKKMLETCILAFLPKGRGYGFDFTGSVGNGVGCCVLGTKTGISVKMNWEMAGPASFSSNILKLYLA
jgi:hypothetical protein